MFAGQTVVAISQIFILGKVFERNELRIIQNNYLHLQIWPIDIDGMQVFAKKQGVYRLFFVEICRKVGGFCLLL